LVVIAWALLAGDVHKHGEPRVNVAEVEWIFGARR
jgi:hypothetical protein